MPDAATSSADDEQSVSTDYARADAEEYDHQEVEAGVAALRPGDHVELRVSWMSRTGDQRTETFDADVDGWTDTGVELTVKQTGLSAAPFGGDWTLARATAHSTATDAAISIHLLRRWAADPAPIDHDARTILTVGSEAYDRVHALASIATNVTVTYDGRQLHAETLSPTNTMLLATTIPVHEGPREPFSFHVDVGELAGSLEDVGQQDQYALTVDPDTTGLAEVRNGAVSSTASLVDEVKVDTIGDWPGPFENTQAVLLDAHEVYATLAGASRAAMAGGTGQVTVEPTADGLRVAAEDTSAEWTLPAAVDPAGASTFNAELLHDGLRGLPALGQVGVEVGPDYPLALSYEDTAFLMVPRLTAGGDD